jgi:hypothetical protein
MADKGIPVPTRTDLARLDDLYRAFCDTPEHLNISTQNRMDAWVVEQQVLSDQRANDRMTKATWALVLATVALVCVTVGQVVVTVLHH